MDSDRVALKRELKLGLFLSTGSGGRTYGVVLVEFQAASPGDAPEVGRGQFEDVQFERLLHEHDVVFGHPEAVEVAGKQGGADRDGADLLHLPQRRLLSVCV